MGAKRKRRERDRPKAGPAAAYHPNKRVLLSYASDEEEGEGGLELEQPAGTGHPQAVDAVTSNYEIATYRDDDEQSSEEEDPNVMEDVGSPKQPELVEREVASPAETTRKKNDRPQKKAVQRHSETGQWPALGSLSYQWDDGEEGPYEEHDSATEEAMAYLRGVRSERQSMPTFFSAPAETEHEALYESGLGDGRGHVSEGTYIGRPDVTSAMKESPDTVVDAQEAYTRALRKRFLQQRRQMHLEPSLVVVAALDEKHRMTFDEDEDSCLKWQDLLQKTTPHPAQVCSIATDTVYELLTLIKRHHLRRGKVISTSTSIWIWSLLARLDDVGTMNNVEVSALREFGKRAILVQLSFHDPVAASQLEDMEEDGADAHHRQSPASKDVAVDADKTASGDETVSHEDMSDDSSARQNTLVTLDMIVAIIGEVFGQRDLLEFRTKWTAEEKDVLQNSI